MTQQLITPGFNFYYPPKKMEIEVSGTDKDVVGPLAAPYRWIAAQAFRTLEKIPVILSGQTHTF